jgi:hypothetical protein
MATASWNANQIGHVRVCEIDRVDEVG